MEFDDAKENIQPLAAGRNASILHASITHTQQELQEQRRELETLIHDYNGDDPLEPWYNYISWIEQVFPSGGKESGLSRVLSKCLRRFESEERYYQDRRMIKIFLKFLYNHKEPLECFQQLFDGGIGTMVADFYIAWAYCYDSIGQMRKADEIFCRGIDCRAEPSDELKEAYQHFCLSISRRTLYKDDSDALENTNRQLEERRLALSSLHGLRSRKGEAGSIRTGAAIKSCKPGTIKIDTNKTSSTSKNLRVAVLKDENADPNTVNKKSTNGDIEASEMIESTKPSTVIRSIIDEARHQENEHEPGPWNKVHDKKNIKKLMRQKNVTHDIGFSIHEDIEVEESENQKFEKIVLPKDVINFDKPFKYPEHFVNKNKTQSEWILPITTEIQPDPKTFPCYNKCMVYPRSNREFQIEELQAYYFFKRRGIENAYTRRYVTVWSVNDIESPFRMYPNFARQSKQPQQLDELDKFEALEKIDGMIVPVNLMYDKENEEEFQQEELMARYWLETKNKTVMELADMEETMCASSNNEQVQRRKSFFPMRRSLAIRKMLTENIEIEEIKQNKKSSPITEKTESSEKEKNKNNEDVTIEEPCTSNPISTLKAFEPTKPIDVEKNPICSEPTKTGEFQFKLPTMLTKSTKSDKIEISSSTTQQPTVSAKLPFEIFVEEETINNVSPQPHGIFDAEETCSTQMFNLCLKSQSASTPKIEQKVQKRQFNVLRDVEPSKSILSTVNSDTSPSGTNSTSLSTAPSNSLSPQSPASDGEGLAIGINSFTPPRKQLSTILETSEHGTHSTGTTKSSNGIPESEILETTTAMQTQKTQIETAITAETNFQEVNDFLTNKVSIYVDVPETIKDLQVITELTAETKSTEHSNIEHKSNSITKNKSISDVTGNLYNHKSEDNVDNGVQKFTIFQDPTETVPNVLLAKPDNVAGNFERFSECNDSIVNNLAVQPVRFQQDKTETITKFLGSRAFPEDKTETMPDIVKMKMSNILSTKKPEPMVINDDDDDTFDFFRKTPVKFPTTKSQQNQSQLNTQLTPLTGTINKRICVQETPIEFKTQNKFHVYNQMATESITKTQSKNLLSSFMNDFSLPITNKENETQQTDTNLLMITSEKNAFDKRNNSNLNLRDSFVPDFSFIEDTQPKQQKTTTTTMTTNTSESRNTNTQNTFSKASFFIAETETQTEQQQNQQDKDNLSFANSSIIPETQQSSCSFSYSKGAIPKTSQYKASKQKIDFSFSTQNVLTTENSVIKATQNIQQPSKQNIFQKDEHLNLHDSFSFNINKGNSIFLNGTINETQQQEQQQSKATPRVNMAFENLTKSHLPDFSQIFNEFSKQETTKSTVKKINAPSTHIPRLISNTTITKKTNHQLIFDNESFTHINTENDSKLKNKTIFELNTEVETYSSSIQMMKNSTMLSNQLPTEQPEVETVPKTLQQSVRQSQIQEKSLHIKNEPSSMLIHDPNPSLSNLTMSQTNLQLQNSKSDHSQNQTKQQENENYNNNNDNDEMSIYYKQTPRTPILNSSNNAWSLGDDDEHTEFIHQEVDLNQTNQIIENICIDKNVNPFNVDLLNAFLDQVEFVNFLQQQTNTMFVGNITRLNANSEFKINNVLFKVTKLIGEGAYGVIYCGINTKTGKKCAFKQERPPNYWEYYICLEVQDRIKNEEILSSYMSIEHAKIGNNASIFVTAFSPYGSIIAVCNKIKKVTQKNVNEYVVMQLTCELLEIIDHLHAAKIIHADIKADNFLLTKKLSLRSKETALQLIDFGVSIDMRQFKPGQVFTYIHNDNVFKCIEMREERPWTYQLDLYGLAGVIHVLLFGKYMDVEKKFNWMPKQHIPRYFNKTLWERIFRSLLNIRDCTSMPNLQELRSLIKQEMAEKERFVIKHIAEFNQALDS